MNNNAKLFVGVAVALVLPLAPLHLYFEGNWYALFHSYSLGMFFGIISYVYFGATLIIAARIRLLDRLFGHDRVMVFHGYLAATAIAFAAAHGVLKFVSYGFDGIQVYLGAAASALFDTVAAVTVLFMINSLFHRIHFFAALRERAVRRWGFDYSRIKLFHNLTALAMTLVTAHVLLASATGETLTRLRVMGAWGGLSVLVYVFHKLVRPVVRRARAFTVTGVTPLSTTITEIRARRETIPAVRHSPGQFGYIRLFSSACGREEHPFTVSSAPDAKVGSANELTFTIKALGDYTTRLKNVHAGDRLAFDGPYGVFSPRHGARPYLFIAGGIGITPFLSIIGAWSRERIESPVTTIWCVHSKEDLVDQGLFESAAKKYPQFRYVPIITGSTGSGRISTELLREQLVILGTDQTAVYLCGPDPFRRAVTGMLRELGVKNSDIHYEAFAA